MKNLLFIVSLFIITNSYSQFTSKLPLQIIEKYMVKCDTVNYEYYTIYFSNEHNIPMYSEYSLYPEQTKKLNNFYGFFVTDKKYNKIGALSKYYKYSGYDRGHLYPAEDSSFDKNNFKESYYETNMTPQKIDFNRGIWKKLESELRKISKTDTLDIVTGADLYNENLLKLNDKISIPNYFFKIVINYTKSTIDIYYIPNKKCKNKTIDYLITIDEFENKCGMFFDKQFISSFKYGKRY